MSLLTAFRASFAALGRFLVMLGIAFLLGPMLVIGLIVLIGIRLLGLGVGLFKDMGRIGLANLGGGSVETAAGLRALEAGRLLLETFEMGTFYALSLFNKYFFGESLFG